MGPFGNPKGAPEKRDRNKPSVSFMGTTYECLGRLTSPKCLPFRLAQHLVLLRPGLSTACVNLCGKVTIRASEYRCVMSLYAILPRELENLQHQGDPKAKGTVQVRKLEHYPDSVGFHVRIIRNSSPFVFIG